MEAVRTTKKLKLNFLPCNDLLLCEKIENEETTAGGLFLKDEESGIDLRDLWYKKAKIIAASPKLTPYVNEFEAGEIIIYTKGTKELEIHIDDQKYFFIHKKDVASKLEDDE